MRGGCMRITVALLLALVLAPLVVGLGARAQIQPPTTIDIQGSRKITVYSNGTAMVEEEIKFSAEAFIRFKQAYNPISTFVRELGPRSSPYQITGLSISLDEANNKLVAKYKMLGAAVYKGNGKWELRIAEPGESVTLSHKTDREAVLTLVYAAGEGFRVMETITVNLPQGASNPKLNPDQGTLEYTLNPDTGKNTVKIAGMGSLAGGAALLALGLLARRPRIPRVKEVEEQLNQS